MNEKQLIIKSRIDSLGVEISRLGFGAMRLPLLSDGSIDRPASEKLIHRSIEKGIDYFDTAFTYLNGDSQKFLGEVLHEYPRESFHFANKIPFWMCKNRQHAGSLFTEQLRVCQTDYFDFYLCHSLDGKKWDRIMEMEIMPLLTEFRQNGIIKNLGFSFHGDYESFKRILDGYDWDFVQIQINYIDDVYLEAASLHQELIRRDLPCFVMEPVKGGLLANLPFINSIIQELESGYSPAQWAMRWCLSQPHIHLVLSGMNTLRQVDENSAVFTGNNLLSEEEDRVLQKIRQEFMDLDLIQCTSCRYCKCPIDIPIPQIFSYHNHFLLFEENRYFQKKYRKIIESKDYRNCLKCGRCTEHCPQRLDIPFLLEEVRRNLSKDLHS